MVDFLNDDIVFEGDVVTRGELISAGGLTISTGGIRVGQPASEGVDSWPAHVRARVANITERDALTAWRLTHAPISPLQPLAVWRADGSSTGVEEVTIDGVNWYAESPAAGDIELTISEIAPYGWILMQGQILANASVLYPELWLVASPALRVGATDLRIPDMRGRSPLGAGSGTGLTVRNLGDQLGAELATLSEAQLPLHAHSGRTGNPTQDLNHTHQVKFAHVAGNNPAGSEVDFETHPAGSGGGVHTTTTVYSTVNPFVGPTLAHLHGFTTDKTGEGAGHANMQPSTVLNFKLKV